MNKTILDFEFESISQFSIITEYHTARLNVLQARGWGRARDVARGLMALLTLDLSTYFFPRSSRPHWRGLMS